MAINVNAANLQAGQLSGYANQLKNTKAQLNSYKSSIAAYWQGQEVTYITRGIEQTISQIDSIIKQLDSLSNDVKNTAAAIKREDDAAAAAYAKQQRIQAAQNSYNQAVNELDDLNKQREELKKKLLTNLTASQRTAYQKQLDELNQKIQAAETKQNDCYNALVAARR